MSVEFVRDLGQPIPNLSPKQNKIDTNNIVLLQSKFNIISKNAEETLKFCDEIYNILHPENKKAKVRGPTSRRRKYMFGKVYKKSRCMNKLFYILYQIDNNFMMVNLKKMSYKEAIKLWKELSEEEKREYEV